MHFEMGEGAWGGLGDGEGLGAYLTPGGRDFELAGKSFYFNGGWSGLRGPGQPTFYNAQGAPVTSIVCGQSYTFDVPGYHTVWLDQTFNGQPHFSGAFSVPMPSYIADCAGQVGSYVNTVYDYSSGLKGTLLGTANFTVLPGALPAGVTPTDVLESRPFGGIPLWIWGAAALGAVVYMS